MSLLRDEAAGLQSSRRGISLPSELKGPSRPCPAEFHDSGGITRITGQSLTALALDPESCSATRPQSFIARSPAKCRVDAKIGNFARTPLPRSRRRVSCALPWNDVPSDSSRHCRSDGSTIESSPNPKWNSHADSSSPAEQEVRFQEGQPVPGGSSANGKLTADSKPPPKAKFPFARDPGAIRTARNTGCRRIINSRSK